MKQIFAFILVLISVSAIPAFADGRKGDLKAEAEKSDPTGDHLSTATLVLQGGAAGLELLVGGRMAVKYRNKFLSRVGIEGADAAAVAKASAKGAAGEVLGALGGIALFADGFNRIRLLNDGVDPGVVPFIGPLLRGDRSSTPRAESGQNGRRTGEYLERYDQPSQTDRRIAGKVDDAESAHAAREGVAEAASVR